MAKSRYNNETRIFSISGSYRDEIKHILDNLAAGTRSRFICNAIIEKVIADKKKAEIAASAILNEDNSEKPEQQPAKFDKNDKLYQEFLAFVSYRESIFSQNPNMTQPPYPQPPYPQQQYPPMFPTGYPPYYTYQQNALQTGQDIESGRVNEVRQTNPDANESAIASAKLQKEAEELRRKQERQRKNSAEILKSLQG